MINMTPSVLKQITDIFNKRKKAVGLSGYTVREMIGQGGSANVYLLSGRSGKPDFVLRISEEQQSAYSNDVYNLRELNILQELKKISQPHVVQYHDAFIADIPGSPRYYCAVMKRLIPLNRYRLSGDGVEIAVRLGCDLLPLLQSFADRKILHRDIKPENLFFDGTFRNSTGFLLGDFGIAKWNSSTYVTPTGTESTVAPEVRGLDPTINGDKMRCDMYSLGIVMYRYLNDGVYPSNRRRIEKVPPDKNPFPEPRNGSKRLKRMVLKATSYDPEDRFESPQAMLCELQQCEEYVQFIEQGGMASQPTFVPPQNATVHGGMPGAAGFPAGKAPICGDQTTFVPPRSVPAQNGYVRYQNQTAAYPQNVGMRYPQKNPAWNRAAKPFYRSKAFLISTGAGAAVLLLAVILFFSLISSDSVAIAGKNYRKSGQKYLSLSNTTVTVKDVENIAQLKALKTLRFESCRFESGAFRKLDGISLSLETLFIKGCTGVNDYSPVSGMLSLEYLTISNCLLMDKQLSELSFERLDYLTHLDLSENAALSDLSGVKEVSDTLREINVSGTSVKSFSFLDGGAAEIIHAEGCGLTSYDQLPLSGLPIKRLFLRNNKITSINPLDSFGELTELDLSHNLISDISPLSGCGKLNSLSLAHNSIDDVSPLANCSALESVNLSYNKLRTLTGLEPSIYLKTIAAAHNRITSIEGLTNCTLLEYVDLSGNKISDISVLAKSAGSLQTVLLDNNSITQIEALKHTSELRYISLDGNALKSLSPLMESASLLGVSANKNAIASVKPICNAPELRYVYLSHNTISELPKGFQNLEKLRDVDLSHNCIRSGDLLAESRSQFDHLALHGNPVSSVSGINGKKGSRLSITYREGIDFSLLQNGYYYYDIVDCPLDRQVSTNRALGGVVSFLTSEEADGNVIKDARLLSAE